MQSQVKGKMLMPVVHAKASTLHAIGEVSQWLELVVETITSGMVMITKWNKQAAIGGLQQELQGKFNQDEVELQ